MSKERVIKEVKKNITVIDKKIARALFLTKAKKDGRYDLSSVYFNNETKEIVATDAKSMLIVAIKSTGLLVEYDKLETGLYNIFGDVLVRKDNQDSSFPKYQDVIPKSSKEICSDNILDGLIDCMIKNKTYINIWEYVSVLKILDRMPFNKWVFINESPKCPVLIESENAFYKIKYILMPLNK